MKKIITFFIFPCLMALGGNAFSQTSGNEKISGQETLTMEKAIKDYGYPQKKNTGNADADYLVYKQAKTEWINKNPELYKQMHNKQTSTNMLVPQEKSERRNQNNSTK